MASIFQTFLNSSVMSGKNVSILTWISLKFISKGQKGLRNKPEVIQIMVQMDMYKNVVCQITTKHGQYT